MFVPYGARHLTLRPAVLDDCHAVNAMLTEAFAQSLHWFYRPEELGVLLPRVTRVQTPLLTSGTFHLFAGDQGQVAACGGWTREAPASGQVVDGLAHIRHFATAPDYAGMGLARRIFELCLAEATTSGVRELTCDAAPGSDGFYAAMGFTVTGERLADMGGGARLPVKVMYRPV